MSRQFVRAAAVLLLLAACGQAPAKKEEKPAEKGPEIALPTRDPNAASAPASAPESVPTSAPASAPLVLPDPAVVDPKVLAFPLPEGAPLPAGYTVLADNKMLDGRLLNVSFTGDPPAALDALTRDFLAAGFTEAVARRDLPNADITFGATVTFAKGKTRAAVTLVAGATQVISYHFSTVP